MQNRSDRSDDQPDARSPILKRVTVARLIIGVSALAVIAACVIRYCYFATFWLDEAFVAISLRDPALESIFAPLRRGQYFPRVYLAAIAALRELLGYRIWVVRLLPSVSFVIATILWARLLAKRAGSHMALAALSAALLIGGSLWLEQAVQLKQYSLDVLVALIPFSVADDFFESSLADGKHKARLLLLAVPCLISYSYPIALGARIIGWYVHRSRLRGQRLNVAAACSFLAFVGLCSVSIWMTDHRFNRINQAAFVTYWQDSMLSSQFHESAASGFRLIADFIWGWHHGRLMPAVVAVVAPLQLLGLYRLISRWKNRHTDSDAGWGSRTLGSLVLLCGVIFASALVDYPIRAGRLVLFTQVHTQILAVEGALFILSVRPSRKVSLVFLYCGIAIISVYSAHRYVRFITAEPIENIRPMLPLMKPELANTVWVNPCSIAQVESLPEPLPVAHVSLRGWQQSPLPGEKVWIVWTNMSDDRCREWLDDARSRAVSWQIIHEGPGRGLALAQF